MKLYKFNVFANYCTQVGELWAISKYDAEKQIKTVFPNSTDIYIWSV